MRGRVTLKCLSIGTPKIINFPFVSNGKLMFFRYPNNQAHCNEAVLCPNFGTPESKKQREDSFKLREELRYRSRVLEEKNLRISRGRIVTTGGTDRNSSNWNRYKGPRVFNSRTIGGSSPSVEREDPPGVRPFLNRQ